MSININNIVSAFDKFEANTNAQSRPEIPTATAEDANPSCVHVGRIHSVPAPGSNKMTSIDIVTDNGLRRIFGWKEILRNIFTKGDPVRVKVQIVPPLNSLPKRPQAVALLEPIAKEVTAIEKEFKKLEPS